MIKEDLIHARINQFVEHNLYTEKVPFSISFRLYFVSLSFCTSFYQHVLSAGIFFTLLIIEKFGRKKTMATEFFIYTLAILTLFFCVKR